MATNIVNKYVWLVDTIYKAGKISFEEINRRWVENDMSNGVEIPKRTFHKWRIAIEDLFGLIIENENCGAYRYYIYNEEEVRQKGIRSWLLDTIGTSNLLANSISIKDRIIIEHVSSDNLYLETIINAIKTNHVVHFTYHNYWYDEYHDHSVQPYCLKMFRRRWYLVGRSLSVDKLLVYSLDRMKRIEKTDQTFVFPQDFSAEDFFKDCFGVIVGDSDNQQPVHIIIKVGVHQANYIRALPFKEGHQTEVERNDEYSIFDLYLRPTFDLEQEILWNGEEVEVLAPKEFRERIAERIDLMGKNYGLKS